MNTMIKMILIKIIKRMKINKKYNKSKIDNWMSTNLQSLSISNKCFLLPKQLSEMIWFLK